MGSNPQESLENPINTMDTLLGVHPIVPWSIQLAPPPKGNLGCTCRSRVSSDYPPTWMSQEVSKWLGSVGYNPNIPHLKAGYNPFTNHLLTSWDIQVAISHMIRVGSPKKTPGSTCAGHSVIPTSTFAKLHNHGIHHHFSPPFGRISLVHFFQAWSHSNFKSKEVIPTSTPPLLRKDLVKHQVTSRALDSLLLSFETKRNGAPRGGGVKRGLPRGFFEKIYPPWTKSSHLKIGLLPKRKFHLPTVNFQGLCCFGQKETMSLLGGSSKITWKWVNHGEL